MSASCPTSPMHRATGSGINTPALTASAGPTPLLTRITTPQDELPAFDLPEAVLDYKVASAPVIQPTGAIPECWGHRGASATYPENTKASFVEACKQGVEGIETDIHITSDNVLILFHDPKLDRTTSGTGRIREQPWNGVLEHVRTKHEPIQPIPTFVEVLQLLLEPGHEHVKLNLDCKVDNDADKLFRLIKDVVATFDNWETRLAPRIILGLWHPKFLTPALKHLPFLPRYAISMSLEDAGEYFWSSVHGFSIYHNALATAKGQAFLAKCRAADKGVCAWTVNGREEMRSCVRWGVQSIITDKPALWREVKAEILRDREQALKPTLQTYILPWIKKSAWTWDIRSEARKEMEYLEKEGGAFDAWRTNVGLELVQPADADNA